MPSIEENLKLGYKKIEATVDNLIDVIDKPGDAFSEAEVWYKRFLKISQILRKR